MQIKFIKIITSISLIMILFIQLIWLNNSINLIKEISKEERLKLQKEILDILKKGQLTTATLIHAIQGDKEIAHEVISFLLAEEIIHLKNGMLYL